MEPGCFQAVAEEMKGHSLSRRHVVTCDEYIDRVLSAVDSLPSRAQVREKQQCRASLDMADFRKYADIFEEREVVYKNTFIDIAMPIASLSASVPSRLTYSTTDADPRKYVYRQRW